MFRSLFKMILAIIINAVALMIASELLQTFYIESFSYAIIVSIIMTLLNFTIKPILTLFSIPFIMITFGLFIFIINAFILILAQTFTSDVFIMDGFLTALLASIIISFINFIFNSFVKKIA